MSGHPHADLMAKAAEIAKTDQYWQRHFEEKFHSTDKWNPMSDVFFQTHREYRLKPSFIDINGHQVPEPVREPLECRTDYFIADISVIVTPMVRWRGNPDDLSRLSKGIIHMTEEAADAHIAALLSFTQK
ncbi:hypothetical protein ABM005_04380 [Morganella morganii]|uniref:hypothetical protein n=1 Tax=Morganella morganii TaxID=582 RepID=UPI003EB826FF